MNGEPAELNLLGPEFRMDSPQSFAAREQHWYATTPLGPVVLRYAECRDLAADRRLGEMGSTVLAMQGVTSGPAVEFLETSVLGVEGAEHRRLRRFATDAFAPRRLERLREVTRRVADELAEALVDRADVDFMAEFADRYPMRVMCHLLGVDERRSDRLAHWIEEAGLIFSVPLPPLLLRVEAALGDLYGFVDELVDERRAHPGEDPISHLLEVDESGDRLAAAELRSWVLALLLGGHDDARCQLGNAIASFAAHPDQWALLRERPDLLPDAIEEVWRYAPNIPVLYRVAHEDLAYRDLKVEAGGFVGLCLALAHTDPRAFTPGFDIGVERAPHLAFGAGPHFCIGHRLARLELEEALNVLLHRLTELAPSGSPTWRPQVGVFGPATLPIRTRPARGVLACHSTSDTGTRIA